MRSTKLPLFGSEAMLFTQRKRAEQASPRSRGDSSAQSIVHALDFGRVSDETSLFNTGTKYGGQIQLHVNTLFDAVMLLRHI